MAADYDYRTTQAYFYPDSVKKPPDPEEPEGEGWELVSSCCCIDRPGAIWIFWTWRRL